MSRHFNIICVGKFKDKNILALEKEYSSRYHLFQLTLHELKNHGEDIEKEGEDILKKRDDLAQGAGAITFLLAEQGDLYDSKEFSLVIKKALEDPRPVILIIAGAHGASKKLKAAIRTHLSLSTLTFPHLLARPILMEQLYRAQTLLTGHPYHH